MKKRAFENIYLAMGLLLSCLLMVPYLLLGTGSVITYHDQLDGELLNYVLAAKYLFTGVRVYPEIMNGLPAAGAVPPAPLFVLFYVLFRPFTAFLFSQWILYGVSFLGMYLLLRKLTQKKEVSFGVAVVFMLMPFYPVYGLSIPGQPLLLFAVASLVGAEAAKEPRRRRLAYYLLIVLYGASSSLVLVGFGCLLALGIFALFRTFFRLCRGKGIPLSSWIALAVLLLTYLVTNPDLVRQAILPETTYVSHRVEMVHYAKSFFSSWKEMFTVGGSYTQSYHGIVFVLIAVCVLVYIYLLFRRRVSGRDGWADFLCRKGGRPLYKAAGVFLLIFLICLAYAFYCGGFMTELKNASDGLFKTFNLSRIYWLLPTAWCVLAGYLLEFLTGLTEEKTASGVCGKAGARWKNCLKHGAVLVVCGIWGGYALLHSPLRPNLSKVIKEEIAGGDYYALDWDSFFAEDIFSQIEAAIGRPKESYRVVSIGIYPAAAAYNGFYCLDGYSNNYPLTYKHDFRRVMAGELDKSEYVRTLFDTWGNRCYITTAEYNDYYTFEKKWNSVVSDLDLDMNRLREMGGQYIFSAAYIMNAEEKGLSLLREAPFETEGSWYHIYVYAVHSD